MFSIKNFTANSYDEQVEHLLQKVQEAAERLQTARRSCEEADENLRYATLGLQEGVIPVSNVLEAQTASITQSLAAITEGDIDFEINEAMTATRCSSSGLMPLALATLR